MFCAQCGNKIEIEGARFCPNCGFDLMATAVAAPVAPMQQPQLSQMAAVQPPQPISILKTDEPATMHIDAKPAVVVQKAQQMAVRNQAPVPLVVQDNLFKAKCEYCMTVFTYHTSNLGYRKWYRHGFVYCPSCRQPLRHSNDLLEQIFDVYVNPDGTFTGVPRQ